MSKVATVDIGYNACLHRIASLNIQMQYWNKLFASTLTVLQHKLCLFSVDETAFCIAFDPITQSNKVNYSLFALHVYFDFFLLVN